MCSLIVFIQKHGVHNYSIFLLPTTNQLFAYAEIEGTGSVIGAAHSQAAYTSTSVAVYMAVCHVPADDERWVAIAKTDVCQRWWKHMSSVMPSNPDNSPVAVPLQEVFHLS